MSEQQPDQQAAVRHALYRSADDAAEDGELELIVNSIVDVKGDRAHVSSVRLRLGGAPRAPQLIACDRVEDELRLRSDGAWELTRRTIAGASSGVPAP